MTEKIDNELNRLIEDGKYLAKILSQKEAHSYEMWYVESKKYVKQIIPDSEQEFEELYNGKQYINVKTYLSLPNDDRHKKLYHDDAVKSLKMQVGILEGAKSILQNKLKSIKNLLASDFFDNELDAARELNNKGFNRASGAVCGTILEGHLKEVSENHNIKIEKKNPTLADYNDALKENVYEIDDWRYIQYLGDLRNKCDHKKDDDPTKEEIDTLIRGTEKVIKSIY